jgi:hypothetical protein
MAPNQPRKSPGESPKEPPEGPSEKHPGVASGSYPKPIRASTFEKTPSPEITARAKEVISDRLAARPITIDTYKYGRIDHDKEIRILRVFPGKRDDKIRGQLYTTKLGLSASDPKSVEYTALSYCWGKPEEKPSHGIELWHEKYVHNSFPQSLS